MDVSDIELPRSLPHRKAILSNCRKYDTNVLIGAAIVGRDALLPLLRYILTSLPDLNVPVQLASEALFFAVDQDCAESVEALIFGLGASPFKLINDNSATHLAASNGKCKALASILFQDKERRAINVANTWGMCPVHLAVWYNQIEALRLLVRHDPAALTVEVSSQYSFDDDMYSSSSSTTHNRIPNMFCEVFLGGLVPYSLCNKGITVAHVAVRNEDLRTLEEIVRLALVAETGPSSWPRNYTNPYRKSGHLCERFDLTRKKKSDARAERPALEDLQTSAIRLREGQRHGVNAAKIPLEIEVQSTLDQVVEKAVEACTSNCGNEVYADELPVTAARVLEGPSENGATPLHCAAHIENENLIRHLARLGVNMFAKDKELRTILHVVASGGDDCCDLVHMLVNEFHLDINAIDANGWTPLHCAAKSSMPGKAMVLKLLELGAQCDSRNFYNETPLYLSARSRWLGLPSTFMELLRAGADYKATCGWGKPQSILKELMSYVRPRNFRKVFSQGGTRDSHRSSDLYSLYNLFLSTENESTDRGPVALKEASEEGKEELIGRPEREILLFYAITNSIPLDVDSAKLLLKAGANVNYVDDRGWSVLHAAAEDDEYADVIQVLVDHGADLHATCPEFEFDSDSEDEFKTPLHAAAERGTAKCVRALLAAGAMWNVPGTSSPLDEAIRHSSLRAALALVDGGADLCSHGIQGYTPLHNAASMGKPKMVRLLLDAGCPVDVRTPDLQTPLHVAAAGESWRMKKFLKIARILISRGADLSAVDREGLSPLHHAAMAGNEDMMKLFLEAGADVQARSVAGDDPILTAVEYGNLRAVVMLLGYGARLDSRNSRGETALHQASKNGRTNVVQYLLHNGADPFAVDNNGVSAVQFAARSEEGMTSMALLESIGGWDIVSTKSTFEFSSPCVSVDGHGDAEESRQSRREERHMECEMDYERARCGICYLVFRDKAVVRSLGCGHMFHDACILSWFSSGYGMQQMSCPMCRQPLLERVTEAVGE